MYTDEFAKLWTKLSKDLKAHMEQHLAPSLTEGQLHVLEFLRGFDRVKTSDFIDYLATTPAAVTTILDRMEKGGLIRRERDSADRRIVWVHMTEKGKEETARGGKIREEFLAAHLGRLSAHNQQLLIYLLGKITNDPSQSH
ncbi:MAG TPA: MarR family transcriptional regulator [Bacilli bacterium]